MSDQGTIDFNDNSTHTSKAEAKVEQVTKANLGSNTSHSADLSSPIKTSAADFDVKEKDEKETDSETEEEEEVEEEEEGEEVEKAEEEMEAEAEVEAEK